MDERRGMGFRSDYDLKIIHLMYHNEKREEQKKLYIFIGESR